MLCEPTYVGEALTGIGPGQTDNRCNPSCCPQVVMVQIRTRHATGYARLCADMLDPEATPPEDPYDGVYHTESTYETTYEKFKYATPANESLGTCKYTADYSTNPTAILSGSDLIPDCAPETNEFWIPEGCNETLNDPPTDYVVQHPSILVVGGDTGTPNQTREQAVTALAWGEWSEWVDFLEVDVSGGSSGGGYLTHELAFCTMGDNGNLLSFVASAAQMESELRVWGGFPVHVAVTVGTSAEDGEIGRHTLQPMIPTLFTVSPPSAEDTFIPLTLMLRCICPVKFAPPS